MSTRTPNINLEKPSSDENYSIAVFNGNSDTIDTEMALRVKTADIVNNLTTTVTNKPLSAAQGKALNDAKVNISDIQNNLTSTATTKPLSAAQGKALSDTIATQTAYNTVFCSNKSQVQSTIWNFCSQTDKKKLHLQIVNSSKDDVFTSLINETIVNAVLTEATDVWSNHPNFIAYSGNGIIYTGVLACTSTTVEINTATKLPSLGEVALKGATVNSFNNIKMCYFVDSDGLRIYNILGKQVLAEFTGTTSQTITLDIPVAYCSLVYVELFNSAGEIVNSQVYHPSEVYDGKSARLYGESSSMWGLVTFNGGIGATVTCNRTSANTQKIRIIGVL